MSKESIYRSDAPASHVMDSTATSCIVLDFDCQDEFNSPAGSPYVYSPESSVVVLDFNESHNCSTESVMLVFGLQLISHETLASIYTDSESSPFKSSDECRKATALY